MKQKDIEHLEWIYGRILNVYGEREHVDFMLKFKEIIEDLKKDRGQELAEMVVRVWNEDGENGEIQMRTPIAWYRVLRIAEDMMPECNFCHQRGYHKMSCPTKKMTIQISTIACNMCKENLAEKEGLCSTCWGDVNA